MTVTEKVRRWDLYYLRLAFEVAKGSKCRRAQYGSVIVSNDGRLVSTGYNGKPRAAINDGVCYREGLPPNAPKENCCLHSELNAIAFSSPEERQDGTFYCSGVPCNDCALVLMQSGIRRLVFYDGPQQSGHRGSSDENYWRKYGYASRIERVAYHLSDFGDERPEALREIRHDSFG